MSREYRNPLRSFWVGVSWGLGHSTVLLLIGITIIALRLAIPDRLSLLLEFLVGIMLVGLGVQLYTSSGRRGFISTSTDTKRMLIAIFTRTSVSQAMGGCTTRCGELAGPF